MPSLTKVQTGFLEPQGAFTLDVGTASAPGLKFSTSAATGMFSPSAGVLGFSTGSTQSALTILADGKVGIGSTSPSSSLSFSNTVGRKIDLWNTSVPYTYSIGIESGELRLSTGTDSIISFYRNGYTGIESVRISSNGNVGIGTTNPSLRLDVQTSSSADVAIFKGNTAGTLLTIDNNTLDDYKIGGVNTVAPLVVYNNTDARYEMVFDGSGNVGIGTTAPLYNTHIYGSVNGLVSLVVANKLTDVSSRAFFALENDLGGQGSLHFTGSTFANTGYARPSCLALYTSGANSSGGIAIAARNSSGYIDFYTGGNNQRAIIDNAGNVGIGVTNPSTKLAVNGTITESTNGTNYWPVVTQQDIGTAPNQVPINGYLGSLAYEDSDSVSIGLLDITGRSSLPTSEDFGGLRIQNTSTKTYPTTSSFTVTSGIYQDIQIGTSQSIPSGSFSNVRGNYNRLIKNDGTNTDVIGMFVTADTNVIEWSDTNLAARYAGSLTSLLISGTNTSGNCQINGSNSNISITNPSNTSIVGLFLNGVGTNINIGTYGSTSQTVTVTSATALTCGFQCPHNQVGRNLTITTAYGVRAFLSFGGNFGGYDGSNCVTTITNLYQFEATGYLGALGTGSTTTITNLYGLFLGAPTTHAGTTITNNWGLYQNWSSAKNWFAGASNQFPNITTTASGANAFLDSADSNRLYRSSSSLVYKKDVETLDHTYADNIHLLRPVWYRSKCEADCSDWSWFGLIAEEVAEIEPRLVHYGYQEDAYEVVDITETVDLPPEDPRRELGEETEEVTKQERRLKEDAQQVPNGIAYDRLTVLLLDVIQRQEERIKALEQHVFPQP